jgi:hypothetical protein
MNTQYSQHYCSSSLVTAHLHPYLKSNSNMTSSTSRYLDQSPPLYEEVKQIDCYDNATDASPVPDFPSPTASPTEVSNFLYHLLMSTKALSSEKQARDVADRWKLGTGQELQTYSAAMYSSIFGKDEGWITYREVKLAISKEKHKEPWHRYYFCKFFSLSLSLCSLRQTSRRQSRLTYTLPQTSGSSHCFSARQ